MTDDEYESAKAQLDTQLNALAPEKVGVILEWEFAHRLRRYGLIGRKLTDLIFDQWYVPTYHDNFVVMVFDGDPQLNGEPFAIRSVRT